MSAKRLEEIDQDLIQLLSQRIEVLAEANSLEQDVALPALLAQAGVPEFVWKSLVTSCAAAATTAAASSQTQPQRVTVIGGGGVMGQFFTQQLATAGHSVKTLGRSDWDDATQLLGAADLVLVCVPIEQTVAVIRRAAPYLACSTAFADITSIKAPVVQAMLDSHPGPVLGLHPMFGSGTQSFLAQNVVVCPGRESATFTWLLDLIEARGGKLIACSPAEHDRMMVTIQAIRHFSTFSFGVFLAEEGIDIGRSLDFSSPLYRLEIDVVSRLFAQDVSLYLGTMLTMEERRQAITRFVATYNRLAQLVVQKDQAALRQAFEATRSVFQSEVPRALAESSHVIDSLSILLAAQEAEVPLSQKKRCPGFV